MWLYIGWTLALFFAVMYVLHYFGVLRGVPTCQCSANQPEELRGDAITPSSASAPSRSWCLVGTAEDHHADLLARMRMLGWTHYEEMPDTARGLLMLDSVPPEDDAWWAKWSSGGTTVGVLLTAGAPATAAGRWQHEGVLIMSETRLSSVSGSVVESVGSPIDPHRVDSLMKRWPVLH
jgi:hypothetical protein